MKFSALVVVSMCVAAALGARVRRGGRELEQGSDRLPEAAAAAAATSACPKCTAPRIHKTVHCPTADTDDKQFDGCQWILQKKANGLISKAWSAGRAVSFQCDKDVMQTAKPGERMLGVKVMYTKEGGGKYDFEGYMAHDSVITATPEGVVTVPIFERGTSHHAGDLQLKVLAARKGSNAPEVAFSTWLTEFVQLCTGDPDHLPPELVPWNELYDYMKRTENTQRNAKPNSPDARTLQTWDGLVRIILNGISSCITVQNAPALSKKCTFEELRGEDDWQEAQDACLRANIPPTATRNDIANYIASLLDMPTTKYRQGVILYSSRQFLSWVRHSGCKLSSGVIPT